MYRAKRCDFCGEKILAVAKKCKYCGSLLSSNMVSQNIIEKTTEPPKRNTNLQTNKSIIPPPLRKNTPPKNDFNSKSESFLSYDQVPWYRKNWFALLCGLFFPAPILPILLTGNIYYEKNKELKYYSKGTKIFLIVWSMASFGLVIKSFTTNNDYITQTTQQPSSTNKVESSSKQNTSDGNFTFLKSESVKNTNTENHQEMTNNDAISTNKEASTEFQNKPQLQIVQENQTWVNDWGNGIITTVTTESCQDSGLVAQGYNYSLSSSIPMTRLNQPNEAWSVSNDRAITVIGCWFKKEDNLIHARMKRKKDGKTWEQDFKLDDGNWKIQESDKTKETDVTDCSKFVSFAEKAICSDTQIKALDAELNRVYKYALSEHPEDKEDIKQMQKEWLRTTRAQCQTNECLAEVYKERIRFFNTAG